MFVNTNLVAKFDMDDQRTVWVVDSWLLLDSLSEELVPAPLQLE